MISRTLLREVGVCVVTVQVSEIAEKALSLLNNNESLMSSMSHMSHEPKFTWFKDTSFLGKTSTCLDIFLFIYIDPHQHFSNVKINQKCLLEVFSSLCTDILNINILFSIFDTLCFLGNDPLTDEENNHDMNSVAGVLKLYFRGLENPLFPKERFSDLISCISKCLIFLFFF